ncbi:hypothetical protein O3M35_006112 [Rhynocoris fuscipes]|uniref:V-type proton ATPase subunit F n=1 Tax=Rhynocoris fuscipes TaxID=488301 RepID=A0AAW1DEM5_9HEMI
MAGLVAKGGNLIAVIGDEDTCVGFVIAGIGEIDKKKEANFFVVDKNTPVPKIEEAFKKFVKRSDITIIIINQNIADLIRPVISTHTAPVPAVLEIPSKDHPYDVNSDFILQRAKGMFNPDEM